MVKKAAYATPNRRLRAARLEHGWTQQQVADRIGAPLSLNVTRWENGTAFPSAYYIERLCQLFGKSVLELGLSQLEDETRDESSPLPIPGESAPPSSVQEERADQSVLASIRENPAQGVYRATLLTMRDDSLPLPLTPLIGREEEVALVCALLRQPEVRLITITGAGGIGKTRLALRIASDLRADFAGGVCFVSLAALDDPALVVSTIAKALGLKESEHRTPLDLVQTALRDKHLLLLLDNFERLLPAASQLTVLLTGCPQLTIMVTSRAVLHVQGEYGFPVSPLALPELEALPALEVLASVPAVALFLERARAVRPTFRLQDSNARAIAEICVRLDGLPLALELAAARSKLLSPQELLARLTHRLEVLTGGPQDLPVRQQTLRNTITWSYQLLHEEEQRLFRRLSVFAAGCTLEAAEALCTALDTETRAGRLLERVTSLLDKSLLQTIQQEGKESRLLMLETIREYGLEALGSYGEAPATRTAHAGYYLSLAEQAEPELSGPQQLSWFERLEREHDNLRAALSWLLHPDADEQSKEFALRLSSALAPFWEIRGYVSEGGRWLEQALAVSAEARSAVRAKALVGAGALASMKEDFAQAETLCVEGWELYRELGDRRGSAAALSRWGYAALMRSNYAQARARLQEALALFREVGDNGGRASALHRLATVLFYQGEYAQAQALLEECRVLTSEGGDVQDHALALALLGIVLLYQGDLAQARTRLEESHAVSREMGYKRNIGLSILFLGLLAILQGEVAMARSLLEESLVLFKEVGERGRMAEVFFSLGFISFSQGDFAAARGLMEESLKISFELNHRWDTAGYLEGVAAVLAAQGEPVRAVRFMSAAQAVREAIGTPLPSLFQAPHEFTLASVRTQLGEQAFAAAWAEGQTMPLEQMLTVG